MHISEGILNPSTLIAGWIVSAPLFALGVYKIKQEQIPKIALLSAFFFMGSFIHIPFGPTNFHLLLSGVVGAIGGGYSIISIAIALAFQALLFGFGGIGVLGVNVLIIAIPPIVVWFFMRKKIMTLKTWQLFLGGALPTFFSLVLLCLVLVTNHATLKYGVLAVFLYNLPLIFIEGLISVAIIKFIRKYSPKLL